MSNIKLFIIILLCLFAMGVMLERDNNVITLNDYVNEDYISDWVYVYKLARVRNSDKTAIVYSDSILKFSHQYSVSARVIARQSLKESGMRRWATSYKKVIVTNDDVVVTNRKVLARGASQITSDWNYLLYYIDDGKLAKSLKYRESRGMNVNFDRYFYRIPYSIEMQCFIMSNLMRRYNNDVVKALLSYWAGSSSSQFRYYSKGKRYLRNHYVRDILTDGYVKKTFRAYGGESEYIKQGDAYIRQRIWDKLYARHTNGKI